MCCRQGPGGSVDVSTVVGKLKKKKKFRKDNYYYCSWEFFPYIFPNEAVTFTFTFLLLDPNAQEIKDIYGLRGQVEHKLAFLRTHVPKEMKLVVIGHSIGCYISLQILKHGPELPVSTPQG